MKRNALLTVTLALGAALAGCATSGDLARVQEEEREIGARADQALKDAQTAKATADAAKQQADAAAVRAENAAKKAEENERMAAERERLAAERERIADEKADRAAAAFQNSMRK